MARNSNTAANLPATPVAAPARTIAQAAPTNATRAHNGNAGKYAKAPRAVATASVAYTLTAHGAATAAANGAGKGGKATAMGAVAVAAAHLHAKGRPLTGVAIVAAMRALPACLAILRACKATVYVAGGQPCPAWCSGYVAGAARSGHGLLAKVTA